jgi:hypothetical protein
VSLGDRKMKVNDFSVRFNVVPGGEKG